MHNDPESNQVCPTKVPGEVFSISNKTKQKCLHCDIKIQQGRIEQTHIHTVQVNQP